MSTDLLSLLTGLGGFLVGCGIETIIKRRLERRHMATCRSWWCPSMLHRDRA